MMEVWFGGTRGRKKNGGKNCKSRERERTSTTTGRSETGSAVKGAKVQRLMHNFTITV